MIGKNFLPFCGLSSHILNDVQMLKKLIYIYIWKEIS